MASVINNTSKSGFLRIVTEWFSSEITTGGSGDGKESTPQGDKEFQQEMEHIGARVPLGRMGNAVDFATVSQKHAVMMIAS
ncbi:MAG: hypothetical protein Q9223_002192 [Gallowayella weberi]